MTEDGENRPAQERPRSFRWMGMVGVLAVSALLVWHKTLSNAFVWYDVPQVAANLAVRDAPVSGYFTDATTSVTPGWPGVTPIFRPLRSLSYRLDFMIGGALNPGVGHAQSLFLHFLNAVLMLLLARAIGMGPLGAVSVALLFLVHPVQSEAVCWLVCRDVLIATTFVLSGLVYGLWRLRCGWRTIDVGVLGVLYMAACLASPQAILFPACLAAVVLAVRQERTFEVGAEKSAQMGPGRVTAWSMVAVFAAVAAIYVWWSLAVVAGTGHEQNDVLTGLKVKLLTVPRSMGLMLVPATLTPDYSDMGSGQGGESVLMVLGGILLVFVLFLIARCWQVQPMLSASLAVCCLSIAAAWRVEGSFFGERTLYLPMVGFAMAVGLLAQRLAAVRMQAAGIAVGAVLVLAAGRTMLRVSDWSNDATLLRPVHLNTPQSKPVLRQLMRYYLSVQDFDRATIFADGLLDVTPSGPGFGVVRAEPLRVKGVSMIATGAVENGQAMLGQAIAADPNYGRPLHDLGLREMQSGRRPEAIDLLQKACKLMPYDGPAHEQLGIVLEIAGQAKDSEAAFRRAAEVEWGASSAANRLATMLIRQGRMSEAADICRQSLRRFPGNVDLKMWLEKAAGAP